MELNANEGNNLLTSVERHGSLNSSATTSNSDNNNEALNVLILVVIKYVRIKKG